MMTSKFATHFARQKNKQSNDFRTIFGLKESRRKFFKSSTMISKTYCNFQMNPLEFWAPKFETFACEKFLKCCQTIVTYISPQNSIGRYLRGHPHAGFSTTPRNSRKVSLSIYPAKANGNPYVPPLPPV